MARNGSVIFYTCHRHAAPHIPPENAPIARSPWSRSWGFFRLRSVSKPQPTSPAMRQGRVGFWPSARTALARGAAPAQIAGPTGCRIGGLGRFRKGRSARLTDVFAQQIHKCALPCIEGAPPLHRGGRCAYADAWRFTTSSMPALADRPMPLERQGRM